MLTAFVIIKKVYDTLILDGELDFVKTLKSIVTASLVATLLLSSCKSVSSVSKIRCIIIKNNAVC